MPGDDAAAWDAAGEGAVAGARASVRGGAGAGGWAAARVTIGAGERAMVLGVLVTGGAGEVVSWVVISSMAAWMPGGSVPGPPAAAVARRCVVAAGVRDT